MKKGKFLLALALLIGAGAIAMAWVNTESEDITLNAKSKASVYDIGNVIKGASGMANDFEWSENGKTIRFSELTKGRVTFINFWGTWCPPCRRELPDIIKLSEEHKDVVFMGITVNDTKQKVIDYAEAKGILYRNFVANQAIVEAYGGIRSVPTTFIVDKQGRVVSTLVGMKSYDEFLKEIKKAS